MIPEISFRPEVTVCPECGSRLLAYRTDRCTVKSVHGTFIAVHRVMKCRHGRLFRSELLRSIVAPYCNYANDVMVESSIERFIHGRSSFEISSSMGVSESHARRLSNQALEIFHKIHEESVPKLRKHMNSYVLQIDGTTDSEFSMIVAVRDSISDFVLYVKRCHSESEDSMKTVLQDVKSRFWIPSGITCDMRSGIISAAEKVFPDVPIRICLMHFLRGLGKDLMLNLHTDLGLMINGTKIKSKLKSLLREIPGYDQRTLDHVREGFSTDRERVETMAIRRVLEKLVTFTGSSGYGFPFSLKHLNFFLACIAARNSLNRLSDRISGKAKSYATSILDLVTKVTNNPKIDELGKKIGSINALFESLRKVFMIPKRGKLSDNVNNIVDDSIHERCSLIIEHMKMFLLQRYRIISGLLPGLLWRNTRTGNPCCSPITPNTPFQGQTTAWRDSSGRSGGT